MIGHSSDLTETVGDIGELIAHWQQDDILQHCPAFLKAEAEQLRKRFAHVLENDLPRICRDLQGIYRRWSFDEQDTILRWLNQELDHRFRLQ